MGSRLVWTIGSKGTEQPLPDQAPAPVGRRLSPLLLASLAVAYLVALALAAASGFTLGRWRSGRTLDVDGIRNQLAVEDLAWAEADAALYASTLDDTFTAEAGESLVATFQLAAPWRVHHRIAAVTFPAPDQAVVTVVADSEGTDGSSHVVTPEERRWYRLVGGSWLRTRAPTP